MLVLKEHPSATELPVPQQNNTLSLALITGFVRACVCVCMHTCDSRKLRSFVLTFILCEQSICYLSLLSFFPTLFFFCPLVTCVVECLTLPNTHKMRSLPVGGKSFLPAMSLTWWPIYKYFCYFSPTLIPNAKIPAVVASESIPTTSLDCVVNLILYCRSNRGSDVHCCDGRTCHKEGHLSSALSIRHGRAGR